MWCREIGPRRRTTLLQFNFSNWSKTGAGSNLDAPCSSSLPLIGERLEWSGADRRSSEAHSELEQDQSYGGIVHRTRPDRPGPKWRPTPQWEAEKIRRSILWTDRCRMTDRCQ